MWHNFPTVMPPANVALNFRRIPESCDVLTGTWQPALAAALVGPADWILPWLAIAEWTERPPDAQTPERPPELRPGVRYRDVYTHPPEPDQSCWVRRFWPTLPPLRARWAPSGEPTFVLSNRWLLAWYQVSMWQPA